MILSVCTDPDLMQVVRLINVLLNVVKALFPLIIIVISSIDFGKNVFSTNADGIKKSATKLGYRLVSAIIVFFIPTIVNTIFGFLDENVDVISCLDNATVENVALAYNRQADITVVEAETSLDIQDYQDAFYIVGQLEDGQTKTNYLRRLETLKKTIDDKNNNAIIEARKIAIAPSQGKIGNTSSGNTSVTGSGNLVVSGSYASTGNGKMAGGIELKSEPDPSTALNYWSSVVNSKNFIYPKDSATGLPLGAWPKDYASIPTQLTNYKTRYKGNFIFPTTPVNGLYTFVYEHNGIDIMAVFGTPIYAPADAKLVYSEWGHTSNRGSDETAYSVGLELHEPVNAGGVQIQEIFLTHMCGIVRRCSSGRCNHDVKKGELVGFVGNAAGSATSVGWAPHLHMTLYPKNNYKQGLKTSKIEEVYDIESNINIKAGE